jgi:hypothetical protein
MKLLKEREKYFKANFLRETTILIRPTCVHHGDYKVELVFIDSVVDLQVCNQRRG